MASLDDLVKASESRGRTSFALDLVNRLADDAIRYCAAGNDERADYARELMDVVVELRDKK